MTETGCWGHDMLEELYPVKGGLIDCHRHIDRHKSNTEITYKLIADNAKLYQKWEIMDKYVKSTPEYKNGLLPRMYDAVEEMIAQGIKACRTYIDVDEVMGLEALEAALEVKRWARTQNFYLQIMAYPIGGVEFEFQKRNFEKGVELADGIGFLPERGTKDIVDYTGVQKNMEYGLEVAMRHKKPIDLQIDQANDPRQDESRILCGVVRKFRNLGYTHSVTAVHATSLGAQPIEKIKKNVKAFKELEINMAVCPSATLSTRQNRAIYGPTRNQIGPVEEALEEGVNVALGTDNVSDIFVPYSNGNFREEIRLLANAIRWQGDPSILADIATTNGRLLLGLPLPCQKDAANL